MLNQLAVRLNFTSRFNKYFICSMLFILTNLGCFGQFQKDIAIEKARDYLISEKISDAIIAYSLPVKISSDPSLISEYAYALALGGFYDAALIQLDRLWSIDQTSADVNYFSAQIFALMGYNELASEFWKESATSRKPVWIAASKLSILLQKNKRKYPVSAILNQEEIKANFKRANELASDDSYFQALALFQEIVNQYPNEFLPYVGFSITLEKIGALEKSVQILKKGISSIPDDAEHKEIRQILEQRTVTIKQKIKPLPESTTLQLHQIKMPEVNGFQMMAYAGGMLASSYSNLSLRYGYFVSGESNISADFGLSKTKTSGSSSNLGFSYYSRKNIFVAGVGLQATFRDGTSALYYKISVGLSFMNKKRSASYDIFIDGNKGFNKIAPTIINLSIGRSIYFGKRK